MGFAERMMGYLDRPLGEMATGFYKSVFTLHHYKHERLPIYLAMPAFLTLAMMGGVRCQIDRIYKEEMSGWTRLLRSDMVALRKHEAQMDQIEREVDELKRAQSQFVTKEEFERFRKEVGAQLDEIRGNLDRLEDERQMLEDLRELRERMEREMGGPGR